VDVIGTVHRRLDAFLRVAGHFSGSRRLCRPSRRLAGNLRVSDVGCRNAATLRMKFNNVLRSFD
jgi:hypothetical protein